MKRFLSIIVILALGISLSGCACTALKNELDKQKLQKVVDEAKEKLSSMNTDEVLFDVTLNDKAITLKYTFKKYDNASALRDLVESKEELNLSHFKQVGSKNCFDALSKHDIHGTTVSFEYYTKDGLLSVKKEYKQEDYEKKTGAYGSDNLTLTDEQKLKSYVKLINAEYLLDPGEDVNFIATAKDKTIIMTYNYTVDFDEDELDPLAASESAATIFEEMKDIGLHGTTIIYEYFNKDGSLTYHTEFKQEDLA